MDTSGSRTNDRSHVESPSDIVNVQSDVLCKFKFKATEVCVNVLYPQFECHTDCDLCTAIRWRSQRYRGWSPYLSFREAVRPAPPWSGFERRGQRGGLRYQRDSRQTQWINYGQDAASGTGNIECRGDGVVEIEADDTTPWQTGSPCVGFARRCDLRRLAVVHRGGALMEARQSSACCLLTCVIVDLFKNVGEVEVDFAGECVCVCCVNENIVEDEDWRRLSD